MTILILGAGVQGTLLGVRLARAGHQVTLIARGNRAVEIRAQGAVIRNAITGLTDAVNLPVIERLTSEIRADMCFVLVRREQIEDVLPDLRAASAVQRIIFMVNHANGSDGLFSTLGRDRVVLGFPSASGRIESGVDVYVDVAEQPTAVERRAPDIADIFRRAGLPVDLVTDMDSWLKRHAVFVTAVAGALYLKNGDARLLSFDNKLVRTFILAVREGWSALDRRRTAPPPFALRMILSWVPLRLSVLYWRRLLGSPKGEYYFALHCRRATKEMATLAADVRALLRIGEAPLLEFLYQAIDRRYKNGESLPSGEAVLDSR